MQQKAGRLEGPWQQLLLLEILRLQP